MEIMSPASLWKDFDRKRLPLDVTRLYTKEAGGYRITGLYFTALKTDDGYVRAFARYMEPLYVKNPPAIIYFNDIAKSIEDRSTMMETLDDYAFLCVDYAGAREGRERYTIYPRSLASLNYFSNPKMVDEIPLDIKKAGRYVWAVIAKRAITLLESQFQKNDIGIIGVGQGGCSAIKACCFESGLAAGMTIYSAGYIEEAGDRPIQHTAFRAALGLESYGPFVSRPLLIEFTSNERNGSMDYMNDIYETIQDSNKRISIVERTARVISVKQRKNCRYWFDYHIKKLGNIPKSPQLKATSSEGRLYFETQIEDASTVDGVELFVSQGQENPAFRNWTGIRMEMISKMDYLKKVSVTDPKTPLYAFVNIKYNKNVSLSSQAITIYPDKLGIKCEDIKPSRLIYDSDMGLDDWTVFNDSGTDEDTKLIMETGPFDIEGVSSTTGSIATFKLSERVYSSFLDSALQALIYSPILQDVTFLISVLGENGSVFEYSCSRRLSPTDNWTSITFSSTDFRSSAGSLESFRNVVLLEIRSKAGRILLSSLLWV